MRKFKTIRIFCIAIAVVAALAVGTTVAFMTDFSSKENNFSYGASALELVEKTWESTPLEDKTLYPGRVILKDPAVKNTGNVDVYVFMSVKVPIRAVKTVSSDGSLINPVSPCELFSYEIKSGWEQIDSISEKTYMNYIYAYSAGALKPSATTSELFDRVTVANVLEGQLSQGDILNIPVKVWGIQANHLENILEDAPIDANVLKSLKTVYNLFKSEIV